MKNWLLLLLLLPLSMFAQNNKVFENVDVLNKLYVKGNIEYKGEVLDSNLFTFTAVVSDTTAYVAVNDTITGSKKVVTTAQNAYTSNNQYAVFTANDSSYAKYTFPTFAPVGDITGVNLSVEYKNISAVGDYYVYFMHNNDATPYNSLPTKLTSDTTVVFGGISNLLGLDVLLDSAIANGDLDASANIRDLLEAGKFNVRVLALDSTLSVDQIKLRAYYDFPAILTTKASYPYNVDYLVCDTLIYNPSPIKGTIYMDTDGHFYGYDGSAWKQLDN